MELEFNPQGTLAERIRAGGAGIYAFFTKTGAGTLVAEGKEQRVVDGETYVLETGLDRRMSRWSRRGRATPRAISIYRKTARNFNPNMATAGRVTVAEVEDPGRRPASSIRTRSTRPASSSRASSTAARTRSSIEKRTVRKRTEGSHAVVA